MRLIDSTKLIDALPVVAEDKKISLIGAVADMVMLISEQPVIEAEPVRHCQWVIEMDDMGWLKHTCQNCGYVKRTDIHVSLGWNYCPNCGCKMDGDSDE